MVTRTVRRTRMEIVDGKRVQTILPPDGSTYRSNDPDNRPATQLECEMAQGLMDLFIIDPNAYREVRSQMALS